MPIYDYKCESGKIFEHRQSFKDKDLKECTCCDTPKPVKRMIGRAHIIVKGPGTMTDRKLYKELDID